MKTRLGISAGMVAAAVYFLGLLSNYTVLVLAVGYILIAETNPWLRKTAVKSFVVCPLFSLVNTIFGFLPTALGMLMDVLSIFGVNMSGFYVVNNLPAWCSPSSASSGPSCCWCWASGPLTSPPSPWAPSTT